MRRARVLITGGRKFDDALLARRTLTDLGESCIANGMTDLPTIVHGAAPGADTLVSKIAHVAGFPLEPHPADWSGPCRETCKPGHRRSRFVGGDFCPAAGIYRNQEMLDSGIDLVIAFPGNSGTADMKRRARAAGVRLLVVS